MSYFIQQVTNLSAEINGVALDTASPPNIYCVGDYLDPTGRYVYAFVIKYDATGAIVWQRGLASSPSSLVAGSSISVDAGGDAYVSAHDRENNVAVIVKYNSSGVIQWQRSLASPDHNKNICSTMDSSANVYVAGVNSSATGEGFVAKYNSSGVIQWQVFLTSLTYGIQVNAVDTDASGNVYVAGSLPNASGSSGYYAGLIKLNSSGAVQWVRSMAAATPAFQTAWYGVAADSLGNVCVAGAIPSGNLAAKYDTTGAIQWQQLVALPNRYDYATAVTTDSSDNVVVAGYTYPNTDSGSIVKYNSAGVMQWQTQSIGAQFSGVADDSAGTIYLVGIEELNGGPYGMGLLLTVADTGATVRTDTAGSGIVNYGAASMTNSTGTGVDASATVTATAGTLVDSPGALVDSGGGAECGAGYIAIPFNGVVMLL